MTTTEPTLAELDEQLTRLDNALATLRAQRDGIEVELRTHRTEWTERAALGDVDGDLTTVVKGYEGSLAAVDEAIGLNRSRHEQASAQRAELVTAQEIAAEREQYRVDLAAFLERPDAKALTGRLLDAVYDPVRACAAELKALKTEQGRLEADAVRLGVQAPPDRLAVDFAPDLIGRVPNQIMQAVRHRFDGWPLEQEIAEIVGQYLKARIWATSRDNPNEPVPSWPGGGARVQG